MAFFLGIDGGGSGLPGGGGRCSRRPLLRPMARRGPGEYRHRSRRRAAPTSLRRRRRRLAARARWSRSLAAGLGLAGANSAVRRAAARRCPSPRVRIETDAPSPLKGALGEARRRRRRRSAPARSSASSAAARSGRSAAGGFVLGDEGSGMDRPARSRPGLAGARRLRADDAAAAGADRRDRAARRARRLRLPGPPRRFRRPGAARRRQRPIPARSGAGARRMTVIAAVIFCSALARCRCASSAGSARSLRRACGSATGAIRPADRARRRSGIGARRRGCCLRGRRRDGGSCSRPMASPTRRRTALSAAPAADRRGDRRAAAQARRQPAARAGHGRDDRAVAGHRAQGGRGAGGLGPADPAARLGHLRRPAGRAAGTGAVPADLLHRGHGAARARRANRSGSAAALHRALRRKR